MPEGDTVHLLARRMHAILAGRRLVRSDLRVPAYATTDLSGQVVREIMARGKHLLVRTDGGLTLRTHLKMDGLWRFYGPGERWRGPAFQIRVVLQTAETTAVGYRLGEVEVLPTREEVRALGHLGPDALGSDWDPTEALRRLRASPERSIGEALLDQRVMAGPGNVYRSEALFLRGLDPWTPVGSVRRPEALVTLVKRLMEANRDTGAQITTGDLRPGRGRWVYGRGGEPCRRCRTVVRSGEMGPPGEERVVYWCPSCQPSGPPAA